MSSYQANIVYTTKNLLNGIYWVNQRITKVEQINSNIIQVLETNRLFKVKSYSKETFYQLDFGDKHSFPICTCHDWKKHLMPCNHFLALFEHKTGISWNSFGDIYRKSPYFNINYEVFRLDTDTSTVYPAADNYDVSTNISIQKRSQEKTIYLLKTTENCH